MHTYIHTYILLCLYLVCSKTLKYNAMTVAKLCYASLKDHVWGCQALPVRNKIELHGITDRRAIMYHGIKTRLLATARL